MHLTLSMDPLSLLASFNFFFHKTRIVCILLYLASMPIRNWINTNFLRNTEEHLQPCCTLKDCLSKERARETEVANLLQGLMGVYKEHMHTTVLVLCAVRRVCVLYAVCACDKPSDSRSACLLALGGIAVLNRSCCYSLKSSYISSQSPSPHPLCMLTHLLIGCLSIYLSSSVLHFLLCTGTNSIFSMYTIPPILLLAYLHIM